MKKCTTENGAGLRCKHWRAGDGAGVVIFFFFFFNYVLLTDNQAGKGQMIAGQCKPINASKKSNLKVVLKYYILKALHYYGRNIQRQGWEESTKCMITNWQRYREAHRLKHSDGRNRNEIGQSRQSRLGRKENVNVNNKALNMSKTVIFVMC